MKKTLFTCLVLVAVALGFFVSCNAETAVPSEDYAYIRFGEVSQRGSSFSASYETEKYADLYWFYTATKSTSDGTTGSTGDDIAAVRTTSGNSVAPGKGIVFADGECLGPFSQGEWTFTLKAYKDYKAAAEEGYTSTKVLYNNGEKEMTIYLKSDDLVYRTESNNPIKASLLPGQTKTINALTTSVESVGEKGTVTFDNTTFVYKTSGTTAPIVTLTATNTTDNNEKYIFTNSSEEITDGIKVALTLTASDSKTWSVKCAEDTKLDVGTYRCVVEAKSSDGKNSISLYDAKDSATQINSLTFYFAVYGNTTTGIRGVLNENPFSYIKFDVEEYVIMNVDLSTLTQDAGLKVSDNITLNFSNAGLSSDTNSGDTFELKVTESETSKNENDFLVKDSSSSSNGVVKSYTIELTKTDSNGNKSKISNFGTEKKVKASLNVGTGLNNNKNYDSSSAEGDTCSIEMYYNGEGSNPTVTKYNAESGILEMETDHFSEFIVIDTVKLPVTIKDTSKNTALFFENLSAAFKSAKKGDTITLLNNAALGANIETTADVTLDLARNTVNANEHFIIVKNSTELTVENGETGKSVGFVVGIEKQGSDGVYDPAAAYITANGTSTCYSTLEEAFGAVQNSETKKITVVNDSKLGNKLEIKDGKDITLYLYNGVTIKKEDSTAISLQDATLTVEGDGTIEGGNNSICIEAVKSKNTKLKVGKDVVLKAGSAGAGIAIFNKETGKNYNSITVDFSGKILSGAFGITINGLVEKTENTVAKINVESGSEIKNITGAGIYAAGYGIWNIDGAAISGGDSAVEVRAGEVNISSGSYTATAETYAVTPDGGGSTTSGAAIAVAQHTTKLPIEVKISGGTFSGVKQLAVVNPQGMTTAESSKNVKVTVTANDLSDDKIDGIKVGNDTYYPTLEAAVENAEANSTIKLLGDLDLTYYEKGKAHEVSFKNGTTLDMNSKTITTYNYGVYYQGNELTIKGGTFKVLDKEKKTNPVGKGSYAIFFGLNSGNKNTENYSAILDSVTCEGGVKRIFS